jgi:hypothetical protein
MNNAIGIAMSREGIESKITSHTFISLPIKTKTKRETTIGKKARIAKKTTF